MWEIERAEFGTRDLTALLERGFEPFAVRTRGLVYLRRKLERVGSR